MNTMISREMNKRTVDAETMKSRILSLHRRHRKNSRAHILLNKNTDDDENSRLALFFFLFVQGAPERTAQQLPYSIRER